MKRRTCHLVPVAVCIMAAGQTPPVAEGRLVKAAVLRSTGTQFLGMTIWRELNGGWSQFGDTPVQIDYRSLAGYDWTLEDIRATDADVLIFSNPGFLTYTTREIDAVRQYVQSGRGLIISYGKFRSEDRALAPLVGLSTSNAPGTSTAYDPLQIQPLVADHPVFHDLARPYVSGVRFLAHPAAWWSNPWYLDGEVALATIPALNLPVGPELAIVANEGQGYRGLYFSYYIEDKADGANEQDMQVFYNGLLWTAAPEPATACLMMAGAAWLLRRGSKGGRR